MEMERTQSNDPDKRQVLVRLGNGQEINLGTVAGAGNIVITQAVDVADAGSESRLVWQASARSYLDPAIWDNRPA